MEKAKATPLPLGRAFRYATPVRRFGRVADEAQLRARLELARALGDSVEARELGQKLVDRLVLHDTEIDVAVDLTRQALAHEEVPRLRLRLVGWLEGLGEPALAAVELRRFDGQETSEETARRLVRIGLLHARAGDEELACEAFGEASAVDPLDAVSLELLGAAAARSSDPGVRRAGAEAYVRAAKRRSAVGDAASRAENLSRAFETDPSSALAAAALVTLHVEAGQDAAADEVLRAHAGTLSSDEAAAVHSRRRSQAQGRGDLSLALGAALDEGLDAVFEGLGAAALDDMLAWAGAFEPLAVRLEVGAESARTSSDRVAARRWAELGRLLSGPLASGSRAAEAYGRSVAADATCADALHALLTLAEQASSPWGTEGLVRAAMGDSAYGASANVQARLAAARALARLAEGRSDVQLAMWAYRGVIALDPDDESARFGLGRLEESVRRHDEEVLLAERALQSAGADRAEVLADLAKLLTGVVARSKDLANVLVGLWRLRPEDDAVFADALRLAERVLDFETVRALCRERAERGAPPRLRLALVAALRRAGDARAAGAVAAGLFDACTSWAYSVAWISAAAAGDRAMRARAIAALAPSCAASVVGILAAFAAEELSAMGDLVSARRAAEQACRADPEDARAIRALAAVVPASDVRVATAVLERAVAVAGPSAVACSRLAHVLEAGGSRRAVFTWARRAVALRPFDGARVQAFLEAAVRTLDVETLTDVIEWLLSQPFPAHAGSEQVAPALRAVAARDGDRAAPLAARALDVFGPRHAGLRAAIEAAADAAHDTTLRATLYERWIAVEPLSAARGALLLALARHHHVAGDVEREFETYARVARAGVDLQPVHARLVSFDPTLHSPDAELAWLEARAELYLDEGNTHAAAPAFRDFGAALWDMAGDRSRAIQAWLRAAQLDSARGYATLRRDLTAFADLAYAVDCLAELALRESDPARAALIATEAARAAIDAGAYSRAIVLARAALERDPSHPEALAVAELACGHLGRVQEMSPLYDCAARGALGRFGRRAAHHRAARFFETHVPMLALKHAAQAFIAVPSEGTTLTLLSRTADGACRRSVAVRTVAHVAELSRSPQARAAWLLRAANLASHDADGAMQRADLLLKAAVFAPSPATLSLLATATRELVSRAPEEGEAFAMRLERASGALASRLEGPDGARIAITFAEIAIDVFANAVWGWGAIEQALRADADVDEYAGLTKFVALLAGAQGARESLLRVALACEAPYANVGAALLRLVAAVADALGDTDLRARALGRAAEKEPQGGSHVEEVDLSDAPSHEGDRSFDLWLHEVDSRAEERVALAREMDDPVELGSALEALAVVSSADARVRSDMLVEAAQAAARSGDTGASLARAREAARLVPDVASTQLLARGLEYRIRGAGTIDDARATIAALTLRGDERADDAALRAFLLAEAEDVVAPGQGEQRLRASLAVAGPQALVALGLAERALAAGRVVEAALLYRDAAAGDLLGLRSPDRVALAAAEADALAKAHQAAAMSTAPGAADGAVSVRRSELTASLARGDGASADPHGALLAAARSKLASGARDEAERLFSRAVGEGSVAAADALDALLAGEPSRSTMLLKVRRQAVELCPGDLARLVSLREAARLDHNQNYYRAIDHVVRAMDPSLGGSKPPPLSAQSMQPGMLTLLNRHSRESAFEAFGVVWESASALFAKAPTAYRMTGIERVVPGPMSTLSRLHEVALRLLDTPRFTLFHRRESGPLTLTVALLQSPAAILSGDARDDGADVRWMLGRALASVLVHNALPMGLPEAEGRLLWEVLLGSFGPPSRTKVDSGHATLAEMLWQALSPRAQRRLKELLEGGDATPFELLVERAQQNGRRVGMFLTGDFAHAARTVVAEYKEFDAALVGKPGGLARLSAEVPAVTDLFRLAVQPEYADARWHLPSPHSSSRFPAAVGGAPAV